MLIVNRFQSINPNKDDGTIRSISDLKNEVKIITSFDETFKLWKEFHWWSD
jgi:exo-beta-1,3-glucanase (GH17 family)